MKVGVVGFESVAAPNRMSDIPFDPFHLYSDPLQAGHRPFQTVHFPEPTVSQVQVPPHMQPHHRCRIAQSCIP